MSVIGVGRAVREQARAAAATRSRARGPARFDEEALPVLDGEAQCVRCGRVSTESALVFAEDGRVCGPCEAEAVVASSLPPRWEAPVVGGLLPVPALGVAFALSVPWWLGVRPVYKAGAFWYMAWCVGLSVAAIGGLHAARAVRDLSRTEAPTGVQPLSVAWWGLTGNVGAGLWMIVLVALVYG